MRIFMLLSVFLYAAAGFARIENFNALIKTQSEEVQKTGADLKEAVTDLELPEEKTAKPVWIEVPHQQIVSPSVEKDVPKPVVAASPEESQFSKIGQELNEARQF